VCVCVCVCVYLFELAHGEGEQVDKLLLVLVDGHSGDLRQTFQRHVAKHGNVQELKKKKTKFIRTLHTSISSV